MKSFAVHLDELHCTIHFIMIAAKTHAQQVKKAVSDLRKQKYPITDNVIKQLDEVFQDCNENPGFTFQICDTDVVVAMRENLLDTRSYLISIFSHEIVHAIFFLFRSLGLDTQDDEHFAIVHGNVMQEISNRLFSDKQ